MTCFLPNFFRGNYIGNLSVSAVKLTFSCIFYGKPRHMVSGVFILRRSSRGSRPDSAFQPDSSMGMAVKGTDSETGGAGAELVRKE